MTGDRPPLFLHLLMRKLNEGASFVEASEWALAGVQEAYQLITESVVGPRALEGVQPSQGRRRADAA